MSEDEREHSGSGGNEVGRRIPFWIWCLAGSGMAAGLLILALLTRHLLQLDAVNDDFARQRHRLNELTSDLRKPISLIERVYTDVFQREDLTTLPDLDSNRLKASVDHLIDSKLPPMVEQTTFGLVGNIETGVTQVHQCFAWRRDRNEFAGRRFAALTRVQEFIEGLRLQSEAMIVDLSSESAVLRKTIESDSVEKARQALREFTEGNALKRKTQLTRLKQELAKLTPLVMSLFLTDDIDMIGEFRDKADLLLAAMQQCIHAADLADKARDLEATLAALRDALTGGDAQVSAHEQSPQNLFAQHQKWLQYEREGDLLKNSMERWRKIVQQTMDKLEFQLESASFEATAEMQERLWSLLTTCLVFGGLAGGLFLLLARAISRAARAQIRELQQARRAARDAARAQSLFLANMSHEIRTPMNGVLGMAEMLTESKLDEQQSQYAATIKSSAEALLTVINDILDFSKIEAGKLQLNNVDFDLRASVEDTLDLLAHMASSKGIELVCFIEHSVPRCVSGDPDRLRQVLLNLTGNAVKFTAEGEVSVVVEVAETLSNGALLRFSIRDTGIGIDEQTQARLFNPFTQADSTTTRRFGGTGLGLAISRRLIEAMGGEISLQSHPGVGSTFSFSVPLALASRDVSEAGPAQFGGRSALIVDDNETNREILGLRLADWKMGFELAADGDQALALLREVRRRGYRFDVALVDLHMLPMDGLAFAQQVKADPEFDGMQVIVLSSAGPKPVEFDLASTGVHAWLTKPVRESRLREALHSAFSAQNDKAMRPPGVPIAAGSGDLGLHILVAEDNLINQRVIREMLRKMGCTSEFADNGAVAVESVKQGHFDLVLMDCQMPEMDGYTATRTIRTMDEPIRSLPILALTANVLPDDREACREAGMNAFLGKPIRRDQLYSALRTWSRPLALATTSAASGEEPGAAATISE